MRRATALMLLVIVALFAGACGVPDSGDFQAIPEDEVPEAIRETRATTTTSTTTTTTSTTTTTTTIPRTTVPVMSGPTTTAPRTTTTSSTSTTTTTSVPMELVALYYVAGTKVYPATVSEKAPVSAQRKLLDLVERVGMTTGTVRLATVIPEEATLYTAGPARGVISIELGTSPGEVLPRDLPLFFAQIVLTVLAPSRQGQVVFTQRGVPYPAVKADGTSLAPGDPAVWEDYEALILLESERSSFPTTTLSSTTVPQ